VSHCRVYRSEEVEGVKCWYTAYDPSALCPGEPHTCWDLAVKWLSKNLLPDEKGIEIRTGLPTTTNLLAINKLTRCPNCDNVYDHTKTEVVKISSKEGKNEKRKRIERW